MFVQANATYTFNRLSKIQIYAKKKLLLIKLFKDIRMNC